MSPKDPATSQTELTWSEIRRHNERDSRWIVVEDQVYDVTNWCRRHPGGSRVISHYAGQDATEAFRAFHVDLRRVGKWLGPLRKGRVDPEDPERRAAMKRDFEELRQSAERDGLFRASFAFYALMFAQIFALEAVAYFVLRHFGVGWLPYLTAVAIYSTAQVQASWLQHDCGHLSITRVNWLDHLLHQISMSFFKGASVHWWNHLHFQHHSKPNVMDKDPDVRIQPLFVVGETMPREVAQARKNSWIPYQFQQIYFLFVGPPLLFPVYFQFTNVQHAITRRCYKDLCFMGLFFAKLFYLYGPMLGAGGALAYYFIVRIIESHWFTWVSQSNHIPMEIEHDREEPWLTLQLHATCDIEKSFFNDWFTGHLNFQIEHHLFPTMPRHNYYKVQPRVRQLCEKYGIRHVVKPLWTAFFDIVRSLQKSGQIWYSTVNEKRNG